MNFKGLNSIPTVDVDTSNTIINTTIGSGEDGFPLPQHKPSAVKSNKGSISADTEDFFREAVNLIDKRLRHPEPHCRGNN